MKLSKWVPVVALLSIFIFGCAQSLEMSEMDAKSTMRSIATASAKFEIDQRRPPRDLNELIDAGFIKVRPKILKQWEFFINWPDEIVAYSTEAMPGGAGQELFHKIPGKI